MLRRVLAAALLTSLAACASGGGVKPSPHARHVSPNPHEKLGKPYKVGGVWYTPKSDPSYDARGVASWYGPKFHGRLTANGEVFDMNRLTAAHPTLPLPSTVRVTNLDNGREVILRVNDRGPFANDRVIDLSREAAERLGSREAGLANVRVQYLGPASMREAVVRLGDPEAYRDGRYASVADPEPGRLAETVAVRVTKGEEIPEGTVKGAPAEAAVRAVEAKVIEVAALPAVEAASAPSIRPQSVRPAPPPTPIRVVRSGGAVVETDASPIPADAPIPTDTSPESWYVQVGAFASAENAARASARLPSAVPISLTTEEAGALPLHRLRIGPYDHEFPAEEALRVAHTAGFNDARIVRAR